MQSACTRSPFSSSNGDVPWSVWEKREHVAELQSSPKTDSGTVKVQETSMPNVQKPTLAQQGAPTIRRGQYQSVVGKMIDAKKQTGAYSAWTP